MVFMLRRVPMAKDMSSRALTSPTARGSDAQGDTVLTSESAQWKKICLALTLLIVARGVFVLCVLPPFEGWDEYQHIAYIVYIKEQREIPRFGHSTVPRSMNEMLQR